MISLSLSAIAQEAPIVLSIKGSIEYASQNNSNIKIAKFEERIAEERKKEVIGRGLPQANINGNFEDKLKVPLLVIPGGFGPA
ncbi:MAG TPA: TolC family protein, partial [Cytophagaceae bacterium]